MGRITLRTSGQKLWQGLPNPGKHALWYGEPARTSTRKVRSENIALTFRSPLNSETGRIRFRRVRFQTPNSVSFSGLTEFRGASSVSSSQPTIYVPKRTHRVFRRASPSLPENSVRLSLGCRKWGFKRWGFKQI